MMLTSASGITKRLQSEDGFSLVELITAITLIAVLTVVVAPRIGAYFGTQRKNLTILTTVMTKTFDDAFIQKNNNFLALHLSDSEVDLLDEKNSDILQRSNGYTVVTLNPDGSMSESARPVLKARTFPGTFRIEKVILANGSEKSAGTALIPFNPEGYSSDTIVHVSTANGQNYSVILSKMKKEPYIREGYVDFETMWQDGAF